MKSQHLQTGFGNFICPYTSCGQSFHKLNRFRYHIENICSKYVGTSYATDPPHFTSSDPQENIHPLPPSTIDSPVNGSPHTVGNHSDDHPVNAPLELLENNHETDYDFENTDDSPLYEMNRIIQEMVLQIVLRLHSKPNFTRTDVFLIQKLIVECILENLLSMVDKIKDCQCQTKFSVTRMLQRFKKEFELFGNEYGLKKQLIQNNLAVDLDDKDYEFTISKEVGVVYKEGEQCYGDILTTGMLLPLHFQIKEFLSKHSRITEMIKNIERLSQYSGKITHFLQGLTWQKIKSHFVNNEIVIPIGIYTDGMQFNNPLGPHNETTDMMYYFYPALTDPFHRNHIHVASIIESKNIKNYGSGRCLSAFVRQLLRFYYDGIDIMIEGKLTNVKVVLCQIIGDNLALNGILEYIMGFRGNFYCRICRMSRVDAEKWCEEIISKLRNEDNYKADLGKQNSKQTGIVEDCVFNVLPYFHCTLNYSLDLMHDFFEGIFKYDICKILLSLIERKVLTLKELNNRISNFKYGSEEVRYISKILTKERLESDSLNMTAKEAWQFAYILPLLIGDLVDEHDEVWLLYKTLLKLVELCLSSSFDDTSLDLLKSLVKEHNTIYQKYFGALKPKMHFITHLVTSIRSMGPPRNYMCFRMEMKHRFFKVYAHCTPNRKNISKTFATKYQLHFANLLCGNDYEEIETGKEMKSQYSAITTNHKCFQTLNYRGTDFISGMFLPYLEDGIYYLYEILEVAVQSSNISIVCKKIGTLSFKPHYESYSVHRSSYEDVELIPLENFKSVPLYIYKSPTKVEFIRPKIFFDQI